MNVALYAEDVGVFHVFFVCFLDVKDSISSIARTGVSITHIFMF